MNGNGDDTTEAKAGPVFRCFYFEDDPAQAARFSKFLIAAWRYVRSAYPVGGLPERIKVDPVYHDSGLADEDLTANAASYDLIVLDLLQRNQEGRDVEVGVSLARTARLALGIESRQPAIVAISSAESEASFDGDSVRFELAARTPVDRGYGTRGTTFIPKGALLRDKMTVEELGKRLARVIYDAREDNSQQEVLKTENVFVAYDFQISDAMKRNLVFVDRLLDADQKLPNLFVPGLNAVQGQIWMDIVKAGILWADRVIGFLDKPNANVGFELGYALGLGKRIYLAHYEKELPEWLQYPPFKGYICTKLQSVDSVKEALLGGQGVTVTGAFTSGGDRLVLCPSGEGSGFVQTSAFPSSWRLFKSHAWSLAELPILLQGVESVIWVILDQAEDRDGFENSSLSVISGYALAKGIKLYVFQEADSRCVMDVISKRHVFKEFGGEHRTLKSWLDDPSSWEAFE